MLPISKEGLEASLRILDVWLIIFGVLVAIGVAGESIFGFLHWRRSNDLHVVQSAENLAQRERAANAERDAADAKKTAAEAERKLLEVQERLQPRILTDTQSAAITSAMARFAVLPNTSQRQSVAVFSVSGTFESTALANGIAATLIAAGWTMNRYPVTFGISLAVSGVGILTSSNTRGIAVANALAAVLNDQGIRAFVIPQRRGGCEEMEGFTPDRIVSDPFCSQISVMVGDHP